VIIVASTSTTGSACASVRAGDAGAGDAGAGDAGAGDAGDAGAGVDAGADVAHAFGDGAPAGGFGVTSARHDERGANTPW
jgi:streptogrisin D